MDGHIDGQMVVLNAASAGYLALVAALDIPTLVTVLVGVSVVVVNAVKAAESWSKRQESRKRRRMLEEQENRDLEETPD